MIFGLFEANKPAILLAIGVLAGGWVAFNTISPALRTGVYCGPTFSLKRAEKPMKFWLLILFALALPAIILIGLIAVITKPL